MPDRLSSWPEVTAFVLIFAIVSIDSLTSVGSIMFKCTSIMASQCMVKNSKGNMGPKCFLNAFDRAFESH